jgi:hypothetical protein
MIAFGAVWKDAARVREALHELLEMFTDGFGAERTLVAIPLVLELALP